MRPKNLSVQELTGVNPRSVIAARAVSRRPLVEGLLCGIEIEAEQVERLSVNFGSIGWTTHHDHSLRDGLEFVLSEPLSDDRLAAAVEGLYDNIPDRLLFSPSPRAGTHIHINVSDKTFGVVQGMFAVMYIIDRLVFEWAGDDRLWCSYCNSLNTLPSHTLRRVLRNTDSPSWYREYLWPHRDGDRYYGFNVSSLFKYGTLEFRYFPTTTDKDKLWEWLDFTQLVFKYANELSVADDASIADVVMEAVLDDPQAFMEKLFAAAPEVLAGLTANGHWVQAMLDAVDELSTILSIDDEDVDVEEVAFNPPTPTRAERPSTIVPRVNVPSMDWLTMNAASIFNEDEYADPIRFRSTGGVN